MRHLPLPVAIAVAAGVLFRTHGGLRSYGRSGSFVRNSQVPRAGPPDLTIGAKGAGGLARLIEVQIGDRDEDRRKAPRVRLRGMAITVQRGAPLHDIFQRDRRTDRCGR